jgi:hypothetical protein
MHVFQPVFIESGEDPELGLEGKASEDEDYKKLDAREGDAGRASV